MNCILFYWLEVACITNQSLARLDQSAHREKLPSIFNLFPWQNLECKWNLKHFTEKYSSIYIFTQTLSYK